ncbi:MAG: DUF378 domain-containing protein [Nanobdellota archaeon]
MGIAKTSIDWIALILLVIGGINWGLVGLFKIDLVQAILGSVPILQNIVYILVGIAGLYGVYMLARAD